MIAGIYITLLPVILAGIFNMIFTKTMFYKRNKVPIDGGRILSDGNRLFGDNKTWIGFMGMVVFAVLVQIVWGIICGNYLPEFNFLYIQNENTFPFNLMLGFLFGFSYMLFELPNSFIKRRLGIKDGKTGKGIKGALFFLIDQIDSLFGVMIVLALFYKMSFWQYWFFIALGGLTHVGVNGILLVLKFRKNI